MLGAVVETLAGVNKINLGFICLISFISLVNVKSIICTFNTQQITGVNKDINLNFSFDQIHLILTR